MHDSLDLQPALIMPPSGERSGVKRSPYIIPDTAGNAKNKEHAVIVTKVASPQSAAEASPAIVSLIANLNFNHGGTAVVVASANVITKIGKPLGELPTCLYFRSCAEFGYTLMYSPWHVQC